MKLDIVEYIPVGKKNAISQKQLANILKISPRIIRKMIGEARQYGEPICVDDNGYWIGNIQDINRTIARFSSQKKTLECSIDGLERSEAKAVS